jgi:hypothetical protein
LPEFLKNKNFVNGKCPSLPEFLKNKFFVKGKSSENEFIRIFENTEI